MVCHIYSNSWYFTLCQEADLIRQGADQTKKDAGEVRDEAEALGGRVAVTAKKIKDLETLAAQDEELTTVVSARALAPSSLVWQNAHTITSQRINIKVKVKHTLVQALRLCTGCMVRRGSRGIALLFHDHGTRRGWGVSVMPQPLFPPGKDPVPIVQETGWAPGLVWTGAENLAPTGIRSPDRPARSQSLYRLCYPTHTRKFNCN